MFGPFANSSSSPTHAGEYVIANAEQSLFREIIGFDRELRAASELLTREFENEEKLEYAVAEAGWDAGMSCPNIFLHIGARTYDKIVPR